MYKQEEIKKTINQESKLIHNGITIIVTLSFICSDLIA